MKSIHSKSVFQLFSGTALALLLLSSSGCAFGKTDMSFSAFPDSFVQRAGKNIRSAKVYRDLDTVLIADIMWYDPELKRMHIEELSLEGRINEDEKRELLEEIAAKEETEIEFIAGFYTGEKKWNDFDKSSSIWKISLEAADGSQVAPSSIKKINLEKIPESHLFTFLTTWKTPYRITFEKLDRLAELKGHKMELHSVMGQAEFFWELVELENSSKTGP